MIPLVLPDGCSSIFLAFTPPFPKVNLTEMHAFFDKHEVSAEDREDFLLSLLGKAAKSTCIIKAHVLIDAIMDARLFELIIYSTG